MSPDSPALVVARLHRALERTPDVDLTLPQYRVLGLLASGDERAGVLAHRLAVSKPTITALVDSLVERGLVERLDDPLDRRSVTVSITAAGQVAVAKTDRMLRATLEALVTRCPDPEAVYTALEQLGSALDARLAERATVPSQS